VESEIASGAASSSSESSSLSSGCMDSSFARSWISGGGEVLLNRILRLRSGIGPDFDRACGVESSIAGSSCMGLLRLEGPVILVYLLIS
jgi:hypothetical protein